MAAASSSRSVLGLRSVLKPCRLNTQQFIRSRAVHSLPPLPSNLHEGRGCLPLMTDETVNLLWNGWQGHLLKNLNEQVRGTRWENSSIVETVIGTALDPHEILAFNYASLALNNSFFLRNLKPCSYPIGATSWFDVPAPEPEGKLLEAIESDFGSLADLKLAFSQTAFGMSGSGYVWLAIDKTGKFGIIPTYGAGTILVQNRVQKDGSRSEWIQASINDSTAPFEYGSKSRSQASRTLARRMSTSARALSIPTKINQESIDIRGEELYPLLCVSVHERDWLFNHGISGKERYLSIFWHCVDWDRVNQQWGRYQYAI